MSRHAYDVIVVGGGPTGLLAGGDLADAGIRVVLLEKRDTGVSHLTRAFGVHARTLECLDMRGIAQELVESGSKATRMELYDGLNLDVTRIESRFNFILFTPQYNTENVLMKWCEKKKLEIVRGMQVVDIKQSEENVEVEAVAEGGKTTVYTARYVVAADGARSTVRRTLGLPFCGTASMPSIALADVVLEEPCPISLPAIRTGPEGLAFMINFNARDNFHRLGVWDRRNKDASLDDKVVVGDLERIASTCFGFVLRIKEVKWSSRLRSEERQIPNNRCGRVFLVGDAAHCHSPAGALGMNTGMQDAANLSWKLSGVVKGQIRSEILDSYNDERHPVAADAIRTSGWMMRLALVENPILIFLRFLLYYFILNVPFINRLVVMKLSGIGLSYKCPKGADSRVGQRMPDIMLESGRLFEVLRSRKFVFISDELQAADLTKWNGVLTVERPKVLLGNRSTLVRPDGYIAWAGKSSDFKAWAEENFVDVE